MNDSGGVSKAVGGERTNSIHRGGTILQLDGGAVWLVRAGGSQPLSSAETEALLDEGGVFQRDPNALKSYLDGLETKVMIAPTFLPYDAKVKVTIAKNSMVASILVSPPSLGGLSPTPVFLEEKLRTEGVVHGVDRNILERICNMQTYNENVEIAFGTQSIHGEDAVVEILVNAEGRRGPVEDEDGNVDLKNLGAVNLVKEGDVLARKTLATDGTEGMNVKGVPMGTKSGKDKPFPGAAGTVVSEDGLTLMAAMQGHLSLVNGRLFVLPVFEVNGDVDYSTGNIDFPSSVVVRGVVKDGFSIKAAENITVYGVVEGAILQAGGEIVVAGGIRGTGKGRVEAKGNISADFADQAILVSGGDVLIKNALLHSDCRCAGKLVVSGGKRSQLAGGKTQAGSEVICVTLGSEMGTKTEILVGALPEQVERRDYLKNKLVESTEELEKYDKNIAFLKQLEADRGLDEDKRALLGKLTRAVFQIRASMHEYEKEALKLESEMERTRERGAVRAKTVCYPGVYVTIRGVTYRVREQFKFGALLYEEGEIKVKPFDA